MSGNNTYDGGTTVQGGKLSITGSHASSIVVQGGTLGGSGSVAGSIDVASGVLQPGFTSAEAKAALPISEVVIASGNVLNVGGNVSIDPEGSLAVTINSDTDYTSVAAAGAVVLGGELAMNVQGPSHPGTVLTIMTGGSVTGSFALLPENSTLQTGGQLFRVSYPGNNVTLTVLSASQISVTSSGLAYSRVTQTYNGTVTLKNIGTSSITGPLRLLLMSLTSGVTLTNATGDLSGTSYITSPVSSLAPGQSVTLPVQFKNPANAKINFNPVVYSGS